MGKGEEEEARGRTCGNRKASLPSFAAARGRRDDCVRMTGGPRFCKVFLKKCHTAFKIRQFFR
jgi:hypothetical protein